MRPVWRVQRDSSEANETGLEGSKGKAGRDEARERTGQGVTGGLTGYPEDHGFS